MTRFLLPALLLLAASLPASARCIPFTEAANHVGGHACVTGQIMDVQQSRGALFLDFCSDYRACPFTVVVFSRDLKHVGDVHQLKGKTVEISGKIKQYDGRAEIVLTRADQLAGYSALLPPLPKGYDVEQKGKFSAGRFKYPKSSRKPRQKRQPAPVQTIEEPEPE